MNAQIASQAIESANALKDSTTGAAAIIAYGGAAHAVTNPIVIDYTSAAVFIPLTVAAIAGVYHLLLIYKVIKEIKSK